MHAKPISKMQMITYIQTHTLLMYKQTIVDVKQKCKAVKERKQICVVASCHAWVASQEAHLFNVVCPTLMRDRTLIWYESASLKICKDRANQEALSSWQKIFHRVSYVY